MAAVDIGWTPSTLRDICLALRESLARVPEESLRQTAIAENWRKVQVWLQNVQRLTAEGDETGYLDQVPPFPLTSHELRALQASIDRIAQARAAASPTRLGTTARHVRGSFGQVMSSAYGLGAALLASAAFTVVDVTLFRGARSPIYFGVSLGASGVAIAIWVLHFWRLGAHHELLKEAHPLT